MVARIPPQGCASGSPVPPDFTGLSLVYFCLVNCPLSTAVAGKESAASSPQPAR